MLQFRPVIRNSTIHSLTYLRHVQRFQSTSTTQLSYDLYPSTTEKALNPLFILHGLFGSKQNWRSLAKSLSQKCNLDVYAVDLRNHGESFHNPSLDYNSMARDVLNLIKFLEVEKFHILGHSMGGRVAMNLALNISSNLKSLTVVDVSPYPMDLGTTFKKYVEVMKLIDVAEVTKQSVADKIFLDNGIKELSIRQFLLTNLKKTDTGIYKFRNPLEYIYDQLNVLGKVDEQTLKNKIDLPTLFIAGTKSDYLPPNMHDKLKVNFTNYKVESLEAGHWVHAEQPKQFLDLTCQFIGKNK